MMGALTMIGRALSLVIVGSTIFSTNSYAADIKLFAQPDRDKAGAIIVSGPIEKGDADTFRRIAPRNGKMLIVLSGPGGLVSEALDIGSQIRMRGWATSVVADQGCYSACALIWVSGARRYFQSNATIGFHAAYMIMDDGKKVETGMGNADIGSYLTHIGLEREAIQFITAAPPEKVSVLSLEQAGLLGIDVLPGEEDEFKWQLLRQLDMNIRASLLIVAGNGRCPAIRELKSAQRDALLKRATPEGEAALEYFSAKYQREMLKVLDAFETTNIRTFCQVATRFLREAGFSEYLKK